MAIQPKDMRAMQPVVPAKEGSPPQNLGTAALDTQKATAAKAFVERAYRAPEPQPPREPSPVWEEVILKWLDETLASAPPPHQQHPAEHLRSRVGALVALLEGRH